MMLTVTSTCDSHKSPTFSAPTLKNACTFMCVVAIMTANAVSLEPPRTIDFNGSVCISTTYSPATAYNRNISFSWGDISFMNAKIADSLQRLKEIEALKYDWNGNGAAAFSHTIIEKAKALILSLSIQPIILPTGRDSIQMEYENQHGDYMELELFEDGRLKTFSYTHDGKSESKDIALTSANEVVCNFYGRNI